jgi:cysteine desulfurase
VDVAVAEMANDRRHVERLAKKMHTRLKEALPAVTLNGSGVMFPEQTGEAAAAGQHPTSYLQRYPGNLNLSFACVEGESLLMALAKTMSVSSGSACTSASLEPSYVLRALGVDEELAHTSLRFGIGRFTTEEEVDKSCDAVIDAVTRLREMSPLWDAYLEEQETGIKPVVSWS